MRCAWCDVCVCVCVRYVCVCGGGFGTVKVPKAMKN